MNRFSILKQVKALFLTSILAACGFPEAEAQDPTPKVCLALSGGGARGSAHIGVLKVFERERLPIDCIAGTSFGALVGGLFAIGYSAAEIESLIMGQDWNSIFSDAPQRRLTPLNERVDARYQAQLSFPGWNPELPTGLLKGQRLRELLDILTSEPMLRAQYDFDNLPVQFQAVATNLTDGKAYVFRKGSMSEALRASMAIPMLFTPLEKEDALLVDGGLANNLPTDVAQAMGADIIIAVDAASPLLRKDEIRTFINVIDQSLSLRTEENSEHNRKLASILLKPELEPFTSNNYEMIPAIISRGEEEANRRLVELKALFAGIPPRVPRALQKSGMPAIESLSFRGLKKIKAEQVKANLRVRAGDAVSPAAIGADVGRLYATRWFDSVGYALEPVGGNRYRLVFIMEEAPLHTLGLSLRYDTDYGFVALAEFTARHLFDSPSKATVSSQFGGLQSHWAALRLVPSGARSLFVEPRAEFRQLERQDIRNRQPAGKFTDTREGFQLMIGTQAAGQIEIGGGYRLERVRIDCGVPPNTLNGAVTLAGPTLRFHRDSLDHPEFPRGGMSLKIQFDKRGRAFGGDLNYSRLLADYRHNFAISGLSAVEISAAAGLLRGSAPFYELFFTGGHSFSESAARRFPGLKLDEMASRRMAAAGAVFRRQLFSRPLSLVKRGFLTGAYNGAIFSHRRTWPYQSEFLHGAGIGLALDTVIGPVRAAAGWAEGGRFSFQLSVGPTF